jgi:hypothetical protein
MPFPEDLSTFKPNKDLTLPGDTYIKRWAMQVQNCTLLIKLTFA